MTRPNLNAALRQIVTQGRDIRVFLTDGFAKVCTYPSGVNIVQVLGFIISIDDRELPEVIEDILGMEEGELKLRLRGLSSLMEDENKECLNGRVVPYVIPDFAHVSFYDYLFNLSHSGPFYVNQQEHENQLAIRSFALITQLIRSWR